MTPRRRAQRTTRPGIGIGRDLPLLGEPGSDGRTKLRGIAMQSPLSVKVTVRTARPCEAPRRTSRMSDSALLPPRRDAPLAAFTGFGGDDAGVDGDATEAVLTRRRASRRLSRTVASSRRDVSVATARSSCATRQGSCEAGCAHASRRSNIFNRYSEWDFVIKFVFLCLAEGRRAKCRSGPLREYASRGPEALSEKRRKAPVLPIGGWAASALL